MLIKLKHKTDACQWKRSKEEMEKKEKKKERNNGLTLFNPSLLARINNARGSESSLPGLVGTAHLPDDQLYITRKRKYREEEEEEEEDDDDEDDDDDDDDDLYLTSQSTSRLFQRRRCGQLKACCHTEMGQRSGVVSALDSRPGEHVFDSRSCHVAIALGKQFTLTFSSPLTCKMGTQLQASKGLVCWGISGAALWRYKYVE
ncbi:hypothetical protein ElyMa_001540800 [Elysia marginata]|uniref:Uncharacterized protein n=1 Tax=Elysia marginata TaxID=1093978 RepID=A0AAV4J8V3_9GAST|nr:hypothetical protein ElyMa_001540800 [Elysia marginata]